MAKICYKVEKSKEKATHCRIDVISEKFKMNNRTSISPLKNNQNIISMEFKKILLIYDKEKFTFIRPKLNLKNKKLIDFLSPEPIKEENVNNWLAKFGENRMKIPILSFFISHKEHTVALFFVFITILYIPLGIWWLWYSVNNNIIYVMYIWSYSCFSKNI